MGHGDKTNKSSPDGVPRDKSTMSGFKVQKKKIVTKRGLVAPSPESPQRLEAFVPASDRQGRVARPQDAQPPGGLVPADGRLDSSQQSDAPSEVPGVLGKTTDPGGMTAPPGRDQMQLEESVQGEGHELGRARFRELSTDPYATEPPQSSSAPQGGGAARTAGHEEVTPAEGSPLDEEGDRSRFRTAPGGGRNRVSGGRTQAKAYVSPTTVKPGTGSTPITSAVKVHDIVEKAVRAYQTEPSLLRRRQSSLPPPPPSAAGRMRYLVGGLAVSALLGAALFWLLLRTTENLSRQSEAGDDARTSQESGGPSASRSPLIPGDASRRGDKAASSSKTASGNNPALKDSAAREENAAARDNPAAKDNALVGNNVGRVESARPAGPTKAEGATQTTADGADNRTHEARSPRATTPKPVAHEGAQVVRERGSSESPPEKPEKAAAESNELWLE